MKAERTVGIVCAVTAAAIIGSMMMSLVPSAARANSASCPQGRFCVWSDINYNGMLIPFTSSRVDNLATHYFNYALLGTRYPVSRNISSYWNRTAKGVTVCGFNGRCFYDPPNHYRANLVIEGINDSVRSIVLSQSVPE
jgi:hypothetical protein